MPPNLMPPLPAQSAEVPWPTAAWPAGEPDKDVDRDALGRVYRTLIEEADCSAKHAPESFWNYSSGTSNILSRILCEAVGGGEAGMRAFMERELFAPLGMQGAEPRFDAAGTFIGSSYVFTTARNFARFGLLYLRDGIWDGERILPEGWVDHARRLTPASFDQYGAQWWLAQDGSGRFYASGFRGQYIVVDPARDLVMVRLGGTDQSLRQNVVHALADAVRGFPERGTRSA